MHDGCAGSFATGQQVVDKLRMMGFSNGPLPTPFAMECGHCGEAMEMTTYEFTCPECGAVHGVTPCHATGPEFVQCAGPGY